MVVCEVLEDTRLSSQVSMENSLTMEIAIAAYKESSFSSNSNKPIQCNHTRKRYVISHSKKQNYFNYCKKDGHIVLECPMKFGPEKLSNPYKNLEMIARDVGS